MLSRLYENFVKQVTGMPGIKIVRSLTEGGAIDSKIEEQTHIKLSEIRKTLNLLHNFGAVEYTREKNMTSGWYTYTWKPTQSRALQNVLLNRKKELQALRTKLGVGENSVIYACKQECVTLPFTEAAENNFNCPTCSSKLKSYDSEKKLTEIEDSIAALEKVVGK